MKIRCIYGIQLNERQRSVVLLHKRLGGLVYNKRWSMTDLSGDLNTFIFLSMDILLLFSICCASGL